MIKILVAGKRKPGISRHEMHNHALNIHARLVQTCPGFWTYCHRYVQNHVIGQVDFETSAILPEGDTDYDVLAEFWFDDIETAMKAWASEDYKNILRPDEAKIADLDAKFLMLACNEHVIGGSNPAMRGHL